ncbi:hypothetical protein CB1_000589036 [Camelus ferus]|nr:hypothetical protein CB1_000589036 [Camelus ferus]
MPLPRPLASDPELHCFPELGRGPMGRPCACSSCVVCAVLLEGKFSQGAMGHRHPGWGALRPGRPIRRKCTVRQELICCECQAKFGGHLPVPRAEAVLPYWVPLSLRPRKQIQKMVRFYVPQTTRACPCPCHRFGGRLPMPRDQAMMPYWVPQVLRSHKKVVKRQQSFKGIPENPLEACSRYYCWRIYGEGRRFLKWQKLQALHQAEPVVLGQPAGPLASLLPLSLSLLTLLQALLRVMVAIRQSCEVSCCLTASVHSGLLQKLLEQIGG